MCRQDASRSAVGSEAVAGSVLRDRAMQEAAVGEGFLKYFSGTGPG